MQWISRSDFLRPVDGTHGAPQLSLRGTHHVCWPGRIKSQGAAMVLIAFVLLGFVACSDETTTPNAPSDTFTAETSPSTDILIESDNGVENDDGQVSDIAPDRMNPPEDIGLQLFEIPDGPGGRALPVAVWYPARNTDALSAHVYLGFIPKDAVLNLSPAVDSPLPIVVFSHGNGGVKEQSVSVMEGIAQAGYIVFALDHTGNTFFGAQSEDATLNVRMNHLRPMDITRLLDWLESPTGEQAWLSEAMDLTRIGAAGHSRGGYTVLALAGADLDVTESYEAACAEGAPAPCDQYPPMDAPWDLGDDRITTSVAYAPASYSITSDGLASVSQPVLIMTGKQDKTTTYLGTVRPIYDGLPSPKTLWTSETAGYYAFSDLCRVYELLGDSAGALGADCAGRSEESIDASHTAIIEATVAWFNHYLLGQPVSEIFTPIQSGEYRIESE